MRRINRTSFTITRIATGIAVFAGLAGVAYGATGSTFVDTGNHIDACLPPGGGQVHVWRPGHTCSGGWQALQFSANSTSGPAGPAGATGPAGAAGATGATGPVNPDAATVDGASVSKLDLRVPTPASSTTVQTLYSAVGLTILAACDSSGNASLQANGPASADATLATGGVENGATPFGTQTATLGPTSFVPLGASGSGQATFTYTSAGGAVVSGTVAYQHSPTAGNYGGCGFFGTAVTSG